MHCIDCGGLLKVTNSRSAEGCTVRRRQCGNCSKVLYTEETIGDPDYLSPLMYRIETSNKNRARKNKERRNSHAQKE